MAKRIPPTPSPTSRRRGPSLDADPGTLTPVRSAYRPDAVIVGQGRIPDADGVIVEAGEDTRSFQDRLTDAERAQVEALLLTARERFQLVCEAESDLRNHMRDDLRFRASEQWPLDIKTARTTSGRPCLTINRIPQFIRQVVNQARANKQAIQVNPVDNGADVETAEVFQGLCRHVEVSSNADVAYETAADHQATMGRGYIGVVTEYDSDEGFQQAIKIRRFRNPLLVYMDPAGVAIDGSDAEWGFVVEDVPRATFQRKWPHANLTGLDAFLAQDASAPVYWKLNAEAVRTAEYWYAEYDVFQVVQVELAGPDGASKIITLPRSVLTARNREYRTAAGYADADRTADDTRIDIPGVRVLNTRTVQRRTIKTCVITATEVLEGNERRTGGRRWPGKWIPIVPVLGDEIDIDGKVDYRGMVRDAKDPQRMYNYWGSAATETIALAPRAPWVGVAGQFKGFETQWKLANTQNWAYLEYNAVSLDGTLAPAPKRTVEEPAIQAIMIALRQADNDLKAVMGLFDPSLGQQGPEESGTAILARQRQGEVANSNYADNRARAIRQVGRIIVDLAPKVYDVPTVLRLLGDDPTGAPKAVMVANRPPADPSQIPQVRDLMAAAGVSRIYDLGAGRYDVTVSVGPSFQSRRQEAVQAMTQIVSALPDTAPAFLDLFFGAMDWPWAQAISQRLKRALPPHLQDPEDGQAALPPEAQQQMAQLQQQVQELQQALQATELERQAKAQEMAAKAEIARGDQATKTNIAALQARRDTEIAQLEAQASLAEITLQAREDRLLAAFDARVKQQEITLQGTIDLAIARMEAMLQARDAAADRTHQLQVAKVAARAKAKSPAKASTGGSTSR